MERSADWLAQAKRDLVHARHDVEAEFYEWACFSAQQAAEKAVNAERLVNHPEVVVQFCEGLLPTL